MTSYLQYKAFTTIDEFNEWLRKFRAFGDKKGTPYCCVPPDGSGQIWCYKGMQFLGSANVSGSDTSVSGQAHFYPVAVYEVTEMGPYDTLKYKDEVNKIMEGLESESDYNEEMAEEEK